MLQVIGSITINYDIRQIWDYFNGGIACLPDTVNQQQLKSWFKGMGPWGHQDTQQCKEQLTYHTGENSRSAICNTV